MTLNPHQRQASTKVVALEQTNSTPPDWEALELDDGALKTKELNSTAVLADTNSIAADVSTVAGAVSGSEMQVDIVSAPQLETKETRSDTAATTTPTIAATTTEVLAANASRLGGMITNPTGGTTCYLNFGAAATTSHHELAAGSVCNLGAYTGVVNAIASSGTQVLTVTEFT